MQKSFNPIDFCFTWTNDWYEWDSKEAHKQAQQKRNEEAKRFKQQGKRTKKSTLRNQLVSRGGIGSGKPHVQEYVTVYYLDVYDN